MGFAVMAAERIYSHRLVRCLASVQADE